MVLLTGCTPVSSAYVWNDEGSLILTVPEQCSYEIDAVEVRYYDEEAAGGFEDLTVVWTAKADAGDASTAIALFQENAGFVTEQFVTTIDTSRPLIVWWTEYRPGDEPGSEIEGSVVGVLDDVEGDKVLWADGVVDMSDYERQIGWPWAGVRC